MLLNYMDFARGDTVTAGTREDKKGTWRRAHQSWRRSLFTPMKVAGGPVHGGDLQACRWTQGIRKDGTKFEIEDDWKDPSRAHLLLPFEWRGHTTFFAKDNVGNLSRLDSVSTCSMPTSTPPAGTDIKELRDMKSVIKLIEEEVRTSFNNTSRVEHSRSHHPPTIDSDNTHHRGKQGRAGSRDPTTAAAIDVLQSGTGGDAAKARRRLQGCGSGKKAEFEEVPEFDHKKLESGKEKKEIDNWRGDGGLQADGKVTWG